MAICLIKSLFLAFAVPALVLAADVAQKDLTGKLPQDGEILYYVHFVGRDSEKKIGELKFPGHAYVVWQIVNPKAISSELGEIEAFGFWPEKYQEKFGKLDFKGTLRDEFKASPESQLEVARFSVRVSKQQFEHSKAAVKTWDQKTVTYDLFTNNCVSFTADVAKAIGLKVPDATATLPTSFIRSLIKKNE